MRAEHGTLPASRANVANDLRVKQGLMYPSTTKAFRQKTGPAWLHRTMKPSTICVRMTNHGQVQFRTLDLALETVSLYASFKTITKRVIRKTGFDFVRANEFPLKSLLAAQ
jgi:hypothetical protein